QLIGACPGMRSELRDLLLDGPLLGVPGVLAPGIARPAAGVLGARARASEREAQDRQRRGRLHFALVLGPILLPSTISAAASHREVGSIEPRLHRHRKLVFFSGKRMSSARKPAQAPP